MTELLTIAEAAAKLDTPPYPILKLVEAGRVNGYRRGRTTYVAASDVPLIAGLLEPQHA